jgi:hypothetical protein
MFESKIQPMVDFSLAQGTTGIDFALAGAGLRYFYFLSA